MTTSVSVATAVLVATLSGLEGERPAWVAEALSWAASQKRVELACAKGSCAIRYSTPYLRVAMAAHEAKRLVPAEVEVIVEYSWPQNDGPKRIEHTHELDLKKTRW